VDVQGDTILQLGFDALAQAVTETVSAGVSGASDGDDLHCLWFPPGAPVEAAAVKATSLNGSFAGHSATTSPSSPEAVLIPGTYDLHCIVDTDGDFGHTTDPIGEDSGDYEYRESSVQVTGSGTTISAASFTQIQ
jgi:hypothetical protein